MPGTDAHTAVCDEHGMDCAGGDELYAVDGRVLCVRAAVGASVVAAFASDRCPVTGYPEDACGCAHCRDPEHDCEGL
jgi:hypothetical protein